MKQFLEVGKLNNTHGIKGELKMQLWCDDIEFLKQFKTLYFDDKGQLHLVAMLVGVDKNGDSLYFNKIIKKTCE